eukprot:jgi/Tetstr1/426363/TSEL_016675.t1
MGVGEDPVGEDGMDIDAPAWPPAGVEAADEGVMREGDPGDFYMKVIAEKFRGVWHYGVITGVVTEWVLEDYGGATQWRVVFEDGDIVDLLRSEVVEAMAAAQEQPPVDADGEARLEEEEEAHLRAWESAAVPGSETNALTFAVMKCSAQVKSKNSNNSADNEWQLLHDIMPAGFTWGGMAVPRSHKAMRKFLRVPDTSRYVRHMCPKGCVAFSGATGKAAEWANLPDQHCPECNADRFIRTPQSLKLTGLKGTDVSITAFRASSEAERLNEGGHGTGLAAGDFLHADNGIYTLTDDGFLSHLRATHYVTGVGIRCEDMPPHMLTSRSNWHPVALIGSPEPPNLGKIRLEVLHELAVLGEHGVRVTPADGGEQFVHKVFLGGACGYAKDAIQRVDGVELQAVRTGASCLMLSGDQMLEQMGVIGQIEEDLAKSDLDGDEDGELSPAARRAFNTTRLEQAKQEHRLPWRVPGSAKVTVQSGWLIEDCWHHTESFSLLTAGPSFEEARVKAIMTGKELASPAVMRAVSQLGVLGPMYKRLQGAVWFVTRWGLQNVVTEEDGPERKAQMLACGHPLTELWMENLMGFLKAGAKRVLPKNVCETMMRDLLFAQQINRLKAHRLYREPNPNKKGYMAPNDAGPGAVETPIRLVGSASAAWEHAVDFKDHLEKLMDDVRPVALGGSWPTRRRRFATATSPGCTGGGKDGETSRDNSFFVYKMLKQVPDADPPYTTYTTEEQESEEELPTNLLAEREDAKYTTMVTRAQHFYLATPPPPPKADSDDSRASARPIRAALCTVWTPERAHTAVGLDLWRVPGSGGGSGGEEALVLLDGPGIRKVAVLMASADMSSAKAADLGVDAGELLVAGIHARSQDVRAKCKCYTPVCPTQ